MFYVLWSETVTGGHRTSKKSESGLVGYGVAINIGRFPVQTLLDARQGLGIQPPYELLGSF